MFIPRSVVCHPEKKSDGKSEYLPPTAPSKPVAPRFLQGLSDLKVMDGSQVTMTVQVSGLPLHLFPRGVCESRRGCNGGMSAWRPTQITGPPGNRMDRQSVDPGKQSLLVPRPASSGQDFLNLKLGGPGKKTATARGLRAQVKR